MNIDVLGKARGKGNPSLYSRLSLTLILGVSLVLNLWGNRWGAPDSWHPDELTRSAIRMFDGRTLVPPAFFYGGLHYVVLEAAAVLPARILGKLFDPKPAGSDPDAQSVWEDRMQVRSYRLARGLSALMATGQVFLSYLIGSVLFGETIGVLAALFLCVTPYFIAIAHFATVDTAANFWYWLSCFFALLSWKRKSDSWFLLACGTAGLAIGAKIDRVVVLPPLLLSFLWKKDEGTSCRSLLKFLPVIFAGYALANPALLVSPFQYLDGTTRDLFFNMGRGDARTSSSWISLLMQIKEGMGVLVFLAAMGSLGYAARNFLFHKDRAETGWLLSSLVPCYLLLGSHLSLDWYAPFFFPGLAIFAAYGCRGVQDALPPIPRVASGAIVVAFAFHSLLHSLAMVLQLQHDSRYLAAEWIDQRIPAGASVRMSMRGPEVSKEKYRVSSIPAQEAYNNYLFAREWRGLLEHNTLYRSVRQGILDFERWTAEETGRPVRREPYTSWFDQVEEQFARGKGGKGPGNAPRIDDPDFLILVGYLEEERISGLLLPESGYRLVKIIRYEDPFGISLRFPFVNPEIYIFSRSREAPGARSSRGLLSLTASSTDKEIGPRVPGRFAVSVALPAMGRTDGAESCIAGRSWMPETP